MINQVGKKGRQWIRDRARLIKDAVAEGKIEIIDGKVHGRCECCGKWRVLDPDHKVKRSQGGSNKASNIQWICRRCHIEKDQMASKKKKNKKAHWARPHKCVKCKIITSQLVCHSCREMSVK